MECITLTRQRMHHLRDAIYEALIAGAEHATMSLDQETGRISFQPIQVIEVPPEEEDGDNA